ncbi:ATP-grasp domain-containing protein, partial [Candidatus Bathyarchaeota archaeon]
KHGIEAAGWEYIQIEADESCYETLKKLRPDLVFNRAEGIRGESRESQIPAFCEMLGIPYVGSGIMANAIGLDKPTTKMILEYHGLKTAPFQVLETVDEKLREGLKYPLILKPSHEGSSIGINWDNVVNDEKALRAKLREMLETYEQPILIEKFIDGREFSVGMVGNFDQNEEPTVLPMLEIDFSGFPEELGRVLGQKAKSVFDDSSNYKCPANIDEPLRKRIETHAKASFKVLDCKDWARMDYRLDADGELYFLEVNTLPGIDYDVVRDELSFYPMMWYALGKKFPDMIREVIQAAIKRYGLN